jgi:transcriptional antiterminator NusG
MDTTKTEPKSAQSQTDTVPQETGTELTDQAENKEPSLTDLQPDSQNKFRWYVIHTYSGHENKVKAALKQRMDSLGLTDKFGDIIVPTRTVTTVRRGKKMDIKEKFLPGYILVNMYMDDDSWLLVRTTPGVTAFVGTGTKPTPISEKEVQEIVKFAEFKSAAFKTKLSLGEAVKIVDGPFADFLGSVSKLDEEKGKVTVLVSIFGRETPVELDFLQVSKL